MISVELVLTELLPTLDASASPRGTELEAVTWLDLAPMELRYCLGVYIGRRVTDCPYCEE